MATRITKCPTCGKALTLDHSLDAERNWSGYLCLTEGCKYYGYEDTDIERLEAKLTKQIWRHYAAP
jgi:hypothetical protein